MSEKDKGTTDDSIGRPALWREGRYQQAGEALDNSVAPNQPLDSKNPMKPAAAEEISPGPVSWMSTPGSAARTTSRQISENRRSCPEQHCLRKRRAGSSPIA
jgi:hypothetical protein